MVRRALTEKTLAAGFHPINPGCLAQRRETITQVFLAYLIVKKLIF